MSFADPTISVVTISDGGDTNYNEDSLAENQDGQGNKNYDWTQTSTPKDKTACKASLQFMRAMTNKMSKGDETDQAIQKVLQNLVNKFIQNDQKLGLNADILMNNGEQSNCSDNLTRAQKNEKKNQ